MSNEHSGSSLEAHEAEMKVGKLDSWLFGERGSTPLPVPRLPKPQEPVALLEDADHQAAGKRTAQEESVIHHTIIPTFGVLEDPANVAKVDRWLFGAHGSTPVPAPRIPQPEQDHAPRVSAESEAYFQTASSDNTDAEYQKILLERAGSAEEPKIEVPEGYAPVTFIEADTILIAPIGSNLRRLCLDNDIPLYTELTKLLHCRGLGLCTTCRVAVDPADGVTAPTAMEKVHLIRDNPKYRLSCQCEITGPVKVSTKPAREYGKVIENLVRNASLLGVFTIIMLSILLVIGFDVVGKWF